MIKLRDIITKGWPTEKAQLDESLRQFWTFRDELTVQNGLVHKGLQLLIPQPMYSEMLLSIHRNHASAESTIRLAKTFLFWPGMRQAITDMCAACPTCAQYSVTAPKEPMRSLPLPSLPWEIVSQDLFSLEGKNYLVTVCHYSDWIEMDELPDTTSRTVVNCTKRHFARFGSPGTCHTDNGPQFTGQEYKQFAQEYCFVHSTSSPYHSQGNGRAEAAVKMCKSLLRKSSDVNGAMMNYRNTPAVGHTYSPAQRLLSRRIRMPLPTGELLLMPHPVDPDQVKQDITSKRQASKRHYDLYAGPEHDAIPVGSYVYAKPPPRYRGTPWIYGQIICESGSRSYTLKTLRGRELRRNRVQLRPAAPPQAPMVENRLMRMGALPTPRVVPNPPRSPNNDPNPINAPAQSPSGYQSATNSSDRPVGGDLPAVIPKSPSTPRNGGPATANTPMRDSGIVTTRAGRVIKPRTIMDL